LKCQVKEEDDGEGISYDVDIEYTYQVDNQRYTCTHVRDLAFWGKGSASRFAAAHPANSRILVYYDPIDPTRALLVPGGIGGSHLYILLFALPFNLIMVGLCCTFAGGWTGWLFVGSDGSLHERFRPRPIERGDEVRICVPSVSPVQMALVSLAFGVIPVVIAVPCCCTEIPPSMPSATVMFVVWAIVLSCAALLYLITAVPIARGQADLVIDRRQKTLTLPRTFGRRALVVVPVADAVAITVARVREKNDDGAKYSYVTTVHWRDASGEMRKGPLAEWGDAQPAEALAAWVRATAGIAAEAST
jgi:Protein of unknown function (DUF3592)